jgi:hypothetical protein
MDAGSILPAKTPRNQTSGMKIGRNAKDSRFRLQVGNTVEKIGRP